MSASSSRSATFWEGNRERPAAPAGAPGTSPGPPRSCSRGRGAAPRAGLPVGHGASAWSVDAAWLRPSAPAAQRPGLITRQALNPGARGAAPPAPFPRAVPREWMDGRCMRCGRLDKSVNRWPDKPMGDARKDRKMHRQATHGKTDGRCVAASGGPAPSPAHLQEGAPPQLRARDPPGPGPVDRVEDPLYDLREWAVSGQGHRAAGPPCRRQRAPAPHEGHRWAADAVGTSGRRGRGTGMRPQTGVPRGRKSSQQGALKQKS